MKVIGIVGGVASGKSLVAGELARLGAVVLDADQVAHDVLRETQAKESIRTRWGDAVFNENGEVARAELAKRVFAPPPEGPAERKQLEAIVHPRIAERLKCRIDDLSRQPNVPALILDAAVMLEAGWDKYCDAILFVEAAGEQRRNRALQRGWDEESWQAREDSQMTLEEKRNRADTVIDNSGSAENTSRRVKQFWKEYVMTVNEISD